MAHRLETKAAKVLYKLRKKTVEPVFGIIKGILGFRRIIIRRAEKAGIEKDLVSSSHNLKRIFNLGMKIPTTLKG